jgi:predicted dehydrogenase
MPFNIARFKAGQHRYFADLGGGSWLTEMGPHIIDLPCWALNLPAPKAVSASGGKYVTKDISTIPDTMQATFEYENMVMTWTNYCGNDHGFSLKEEETEMARRLGASFHGVNGTLTADYAQFRINGTGDRLKDVVLPEKTLPRSPGHDREFLDAIKSRTMCSCDVEYHYPLHVALNLGNLSLKLGRKLVWDAERERVVGDKEANKLIQPHYRSPWLMPA